MPHESTAIHEIATARYTLADTADGDLRRLDSAAEQRAADTPAALAQAVALAQRGAEGIGDPVEREQQLAAVRQFAAVVGVDG